MKLYGHGGHKFSVHNQIITIKAYDAWNLEHTQDYFEAFKTLVNELNLEKWGVLVDFRFFKGSTPEVIQFFNSKIIPWSIENGQVARAHLTKDPINKYFVEQSAKENTSLPIAIFETQEEAFKWFRQFDLDV